MLKPFWLLLVTSSFLCQQPVFAAVTPLAVAILPPVQFPHAGFDIVGVRASALWGKHRQVFGLDIGAIGNMTQLHSAGISVAGGFNMNFGTATVIGLQAAGGANINKNKARVVGAQIAGILNSNVAESSVYGLQVALVNMCAHTKVGLLQAGVYNEAQVVYGFQIGLINKAKTLHGLQIGLLNFHHDGVFSVSPILNVGF